MNAIYHENDGWDIYDDGQLVGCLPEGVVEDPAAFDPDVYPFRDEPEFAEGLTLRQVAEVE